MMPPSWPSAAAWKSCGDGPDRQGAAERLMPAVVLRRAELGLAQRALQGREQVRHGLGVVPHVRAGAVAAAGVVAAAFPRPEPAVGLPQDRGRLEDRQVGGHGLDTSGGSVES